MLNVNGRLDFLLTRLRSRTATIEEMQELKLLLGGNDMDEKLRHLWDTLPADSPFFSEASSDEMLAYIMQPEESFLTGMRRRQRMGWVVAMTLLIIIAGLWLYLRFPS